MNKFQKTVKKYRKQQEMTLREFSAAISDPKLQEFSHQTIKNWEDGAHTPSLGDVMMIGWIFPDGSWQHNFSEEASEALLAEKKLAWA